MKPFVIIGTPCYGGQVFQGYMESIIQLMGYSSRNGFDVSLALLGGDSLVTRSRNKLVATFLDIPNATHLMFIDADIAFQPEDIHRMLNFDKEVTAGMYPIKNFDWNKFKQESSNFAHETKDMSNDVLSRSGLHLVGFPYKETDALYAKEDDFVTGMYAGTGFMLIKRQAIEALIEKHPELKYKHAHMYPIEANPSPNQYAIFDCSIDHQSGAYLSEDFTFCKRWLNLGGKIWLDTKSRLTHYGNYCFKAF
ncbi:MAG: hypothetical protein FWF23_06115 [Alphaproteobacteria bacterium]|nr:hypothetical protein [Alphaproteobacteria bacterium]MCL2505331.1 hypothetical protein [Alphaproteobacteria bacterium]